MALFYDFAKWQSILFFHCLKGRIADGQSVSIHNFGTFHKYEYGSRKTVDIHSGELRETKPFINIRFVPDKAFSDLIDRKKAFFNQTD